MADSLGSVVKKKKNNKPKATNCFKKSERGKLGPPAFKFQYRGTGKQIVNTRCRSITVRGVNEQNEFHGPISLA